MTKSSTQKIEFADMQSLVSIIASAMPAASTDESSPTLNGVCLQSDGKDALALASDGAWLMRVRFEPEYADPVFRLLIRLPFVKRLLALIGDASGHATVVRDEKMWKVTLEKLGTLEGHFGVAEVVAPDFLKVWPTDDGSPIAQVGFNPKLMANLSKAFKQAVGQVPMLRYAFHGEKQPVVVTCDGAPHADALLMPCALADEEPEEETTQAELFDGGKS